MEVAVDAEVEAVEEAVADAVARGVQAVVAAAVVEALTGEHALTHDLLSLQGCVGGTDNIPVTPEEAHVEAPADSPCTVEVHIMPGEPQDPTPRVVPLQAA